MSRMGCAMGRWPGSWRRRRDGNGQGCSDRSLGLHLRRLVRCSRSAHAHSDNVGLGPTTSPEHCELPVCPAPPRADGRGAGMPPVGVPCAAGGTALSGRKKLDRDRLLSQKKNGLRDAGQRDGPAGKNGRKTRPPTAMLAATGGDGCSARAVVSRCSAPHSQGLPDRSGPFGLRFRQPRQCVPFAETSAASSLSRHGARLRRAPFLLRSSVMEAKTSEAGESSVPAGRLGTRSGTRGSGLVGLMVMVAVDDVLAANAFLRPTFVARSQITQPHGETMCMGRRCARAEEHRSSGSALRFLRGTAPMKQAAARHVLSVQ
jgi:hypothetical protein